MRNRNELMHQHRRGFTLLELMVCVTILAVAAVVVTPMFRDGDRLQVVAAARILASDIELAQVMTISFPDQPVVVRFEPAESMYWLAYSFDPETPIYRAGTEEFYLVRMGVGRASAAAGVTMALEEIDDNTLAFNPQGGLMDFTAAPGIELSRTGSTIRLAIAPTTGRISEVNP